MASTNTFATFAANYKEVYGDMLESAVPEGHHLRLDIPFSEADMLGDKYVQSVALTHEHGFTHNVDGSAFALNAAVSAVYKEAQIQGAETLLRSKWSYKAISAAKRGKAAFMNATDAKVRAMFESCNKRIEVLGFYGESTSGLGAVDSITSVGAGTETITLTEASFADGIWGGAEGCKFDVYASNYSTKRTNNAVIVCTAVAPETFQITVTGNTTDLAAIAQNDVLVYEQSKAKMSAGIDRIATNTGVLFNIDGAAFGLWKGNSFPVGGQLTFAKLTSGLARATGKGLSGDVLVYVSNKTWPNLMTDQAALVRHGGSEQTFKNGASGVKFASMNGNIEVKSSIYVKPGDAFAIPKNRFKRIGSTDLTPRLPLSGELVDLISDVAGAETQLYSDQAVFTDRPGHCVKFTGIVNV